MKKFKGDGWKLFYGEYFYDMPQPSGNLKNKTKYRIEHKQIYYMRNSEDIKFNHVYYYAKQLYRKLKNEEI